MNRNLNKKGFTLIELSAVMVILGVIMLIAYPRFIRIIIEARKDAFRLSVENVIDAINVRNTNEDYNINPVAVTEGNLPDLIGVSNEDYNNLEIKVDPSDKLYIIVEGKNEWDGFTACGYAGSIAVVDPIECGIGKKGYSTAEITRMIEEENYIPVATLTELNSIRNDTSRTYGTGTQWEATYTGGLDKKYVQVRDIDMTEVAGWNSGTGWNPLGTRPYDCDYENVSGTVFSGVYDGATRKITNLYINITDSLIPIGLFSSSTGSFYNIVLENVDVTSNVTNMDLPTAALVGQASGNNLVFENIKITGNIKTIGDDATKVSALVGQVGFVNSISITNSNFTGNVTGGYGQVGGFIGEIRNFNDILIDGSSVNGNIVSAYNKTGGFIGAAWYENYETTLDGRDDLQHFDFDTTSAASKTYYTIAKITYDPAFTERDITYFIDLGVLPMDRDSITGWKLKSASVLSTLDDFQQYITKKLAGEVIWPSGGDTLYITDPQDFMDHSLTSSNMTINEVDVDCGWHGGTCSVTITETIKDITGVTPNLVDTVQEIYVPIKFEVEFQSSGLANSVVIKNSMLEGSVISEYNLTGGLVGDIRYVKDFTIEGSYVEGDVTSDWNKTGGLIGTTSYVENINITDSHHEGEMFATWNKTGGIAGEIAYFENLNVLNTYNIGDVTSKYNKGGGLFGVITWCGDNYDNDETVFRTAKSVNIKDSYNIGDVTGYYNKFGGIAGVIQSVDTVVLDNTDYEGTINGGYTDIGSIVGDVQAIDDLTIKNSDGIATLYGWQNATGGIVGGIDYVDNALLENNNFTGEIRLSTTQDQDPRPNHTPNYNYLYYSNGVGGIVGKIGYDSGFSSKPLTYSGVVTIKDCHAKGILNGYGTRIGGLVGTSDIANRRLDDYLLNIENSSFVGTINIDNHTYTKNLSTGILSNHHYYYVLAGGLVGSTKNLNITNSYSRGTMNVLIDTNPATKINVGCILDNHIIGGLVGKINDHANISNSYSAMDIVAVTAGNSVDVGLTTYMKALSGDYAKTTVTNSYYDSTVEAYGDVNGMARSSYDLKYDSPGIGSFNSWSTSIWNFGTTSEYPKLIGEN